MCIHTYMHTCIHTYVHTYMHIHTGDPVGGFYAGGQNGRDRVAGGAAGSDLGQVYVYIADTLGLCWGICIHIRSLLPTQTQKQGQTQTQKQGQTQTWGSDLGQVPLSFLLLSFVYVSYLFIYFILGGAQVTLWGRFFYINFYCHFFPSYYYHKYV